MAASRVQGRCKACAVMCRDSMTGLPDPCPSLAVTTSPDLLPASMSEMAHAGEHHRHVVLVGGGDHLGIAHRTTRLDHRADAGGRGRVDAVAEREEGVAGHHRAAHFELLVGSLDAGDPGAVDA